MRASGEQGVLRYATVHGIGCYGWSGRWIEGMSVADEKKFAAV